MISRSISHIHFQTLVSMKNDPWKIPIDAETSLRLVEFVENDKENPKNMGTARKWAITGILGSICFVVALGSAIVTGDLERPRDYFGVWRR